MAGRHYHCGHYSRFHICEAASLRAPITHRSIPTCFPGHRGTCEKFKRSQMHVPALVEQGHALPSWFSSHIVECHGFCIFVLFVSGFAVKNGPRCRAEVLPRVPKCRKARMCPPETVRVFDACPLSTSHRAVGRGFSVNESTVCIT